MSLQHIFSGNPEWMGNLNRQFQQPHESCFPGYALLLKNTLIGGCSLRACLHPACPGWAPVFQSRQGMKFCCPRILPVPRMAGRVPGRHRRRAARTNLFFLPGPGIVRAVLKIKNGKVLFTFSVSFTFFIYFCFPAETAALPYGTTSFSTGNGVIPE